VRPDRYSLARVDNTSYGMPLSLDDWYTVV
jgi:hypothetical protein